jgi:hypothetical protein
LEGESYVSPPRGRLFGEVGMFKAEDTCGFEPEGAADTLGSSPSAFTFFTERPSGFSPNDGDEMRFPFEFIRIMEDGGSVVERRSVDWLGVLVSRRFSLLDRSIRADFAGEAPFISMFLLSVSPTR